MNKLEVIIIILFGKWKNVKLKYITQNKTPNKMNKTKMYKGNNLKIKPNKKNCKMEINKFNVKPIKNKSLT